MAVKRVTRIKLVLALLALGLVSIRVAYAQGEKPVAPSGEPISTSQQNAVNEYKGLVPAGLWRPGDGILFPQFSLVVDKSKKKIHLIDSSSGTPAVVEIYDADLGKTAGDKAATGDGRTPEGIYFLQKSLEGKGLDPYKYGTHAFTTDYPNIFDLRKGKTGYGIWLHAIDDSRTLERGSQGCVVVRNDTIKKLSPNIVLRETPLLIFDKVQWVAFDQAKKESEPILKMLGEWRNAWAAKDMDAYIKFYAADFRFKKMNLEGFRKYKADLAARYADIKITLSMPVIFAHKDTFVVRFYQNYSSPLHTDFGEKTMYLAKTPTGYEILNETWQESTNPKARSIIASGNLCCQAAN